jgi:hypothetical protein
MKGASFQRPLPRRKEASTRRVYATWRSSCFLFFAGGRRIPFTACPAKVGTGFAKKDMLKELEQDDDSKKSHLALMP